MAGAVPARWQRRGRGGKTPRVICIHCTVSREMGTGAEAVARYFASSTRPGSSHTVHDNNSTVRCVADEDTAYGAAGVNNDGLHAELVGMPDQSEADWLDPFSLGMLHEAAPTIRGWSEKYAIPLRWLTVAEVADGHSRGLCTHADVSAAFPDVSTGHWDPGPHFPKAEALRIWSGIPQPAPVPPPAAPSEEDDMPIQLVQCHDHPDEAYRGVIFKTDGFNRWPVPQDIDDGTLEYIKGLYGGVQHVNIHQLNLLVPMDEVVVAARAVLREGTG